MTLHVITYRPSLASELARSKHSTAARLPWAALVLCVLLGLSWLAIGSGPQQGWGRMLAWLSLYTTVLQGPTAALLVSTTLVREAAARGGGTLWRPVDRRTTMAARATVAAIQLLATTMALTLPWLVFGAAKGIVTPADAGRLAALTAVMWLTAWAPASLAFITTRLLGRYAAVGVALVIQVAGTLTAETPAGAWLPWSWPVQATMPLLGIHANGVALEADSPVWSWNPIVPTVAATLVAAAFLLVEILAAPLLDRPSPSRRLKDVEARPVTPLGFPRSAAGTTRAGRIASPLRAVAVSLRHTWLGGTTVTALILTVAVAITWGGRHSATFGTWVTLPVLSTLLGGLVWSAQREAWRITSLRVSRPGFVLGSLVAGAALLTPVALVTAGAALPVLGVGAGRYGLLLWLVAMMWYAVNLWLTTRFGVPTALGASLVVYTFSLVLGGSALASTGWWWLGLLGWPESAVGGRGVVAAGLTLAVGGVATLLWQAALKRAARTTSTDR